ncbi:CPXCG motif-containing cysteine-rich protein [Marinomonas pollencensis]|uniref:Cysteine-rich CPXCG protein n=1 Tax=Marinomonas pollencensis TaxID=491954 RepID=A0A3E0DVQ7_9GAMM|nr:CPXCG motif-containing cysteine-rich protein [Marinomonas pollencensis]REG86594.1 cysteine-rich CPXCG protein [Marinomonas pollencensis]
MNDLLEIDIVCPYCGERESVSVELLEESQEYIEDCQVCCQPIVFYVDSEREGSPRVLVRSENETF